MNGKIIYLVCLISLFGTQMAFGQDSVRPGGFGTPTLRELKEDDFNKRREALLTVSKMGRQASRKRTPAVIVTEEELKRYKDAIAVAEEDLNTNEIFLKKSDTGIFRILPFIDCESKNVIRVSGDCENFVPRTWSYSFRVEDQSDLYFNDISFKEGFFITTSLLTQGIITSLGDVPLGDVTLSSGGIKYLADFIPSKDKEEAKRQYHEIKKGVASGGYIYGKGAKVQENTTYAARIVAYKYKDKAIKREIETEMTNLFRYLSDYDKRKDLMVAFRVIRKSEDGGVTVLWKKLQEKKSPSFVYKKSEELTDFK